MLSNKPMTSWPVFLAAVALFTALFAWITDAAAQAPYEEGATPQTVFCSNQYPTTCAPDLCALAAAYIAVNQNVPPPGGSISGTCGDGNAYIRTCFATPCGGPSFTNIPKFSSVAYNCRAESGVGGPGVTTGLTNKPTDPSKCVCGTNRSFDGPLDRCSKVCTAGGVASSGFYSIGTNPQAKPAMLACNAGCETVFDGVSPSGSSLTNGVKQWYAKGSHYYTGNGCSVAVEAATPPSPAASMAGATCPATHARGQINGLDVCIARVDAAASAPEAAASRPGGEQKTTTTVVDNGDGTTTTTTKTGGTQWDGSGGATGFMKETIVTCDMNGNCESESKTEGEEEEKPEECPEGSDLAKCAQMGAVPDDTELPTVERSLAINPEPGFEHDDSCPADKVVNLAAGFAVSFPFTLLCTAADMARPIVLGVAYLSSILGFLGFARKD